MYRCFWILCLLAVCFQTALAKDHKEENVLASDGPYILYDMNGGMRFIRMDGTGNLKDTLYASVPENFSFPVVSDQGSHRFRVRLHVYQRQPWQQTKKTEKLTVISDPHGNLDCFVSILQAGGVMDAEYKWSYGKNQLVIIGDVFDRGKDVLPIYWLIYKLEQEAAEAGGKLTFLLGNHEEMVLRGDCRYTKDKYKELARRLQLPYQDLWGENSELGRWLRTRNLMQVVGDYFFVHAGLSSDFLKRKETILKMNEVASQGLSLSKEQRKNASDLSAFIFGSYGPFWYRGLVKSEDRYRPLSEKDLRRLLKKYRVRHIVVGHTIFDEVTTFYQKRVIAVNVDNPKNKEKKRSRGLVIEKDTVYVLYDSGKLEQLIP